MTLKNGFVLIVKKVYECRKHSEKYTKKSYCYFLFIPTRFIKCNFNVFNLLSIKM